MYLKLLNTTVLLITIDTWVGYNIPEQASANAPGTALVVQEIGKAGRKASGESGGKPSSGGEILCLFALAAPSLKITNDRLVRSVDTMLSGNTPTTRNSR